MRNTFRNCLQTVNRNNRIKKCGYVILLVLSVAVSVNVFWLLRQKGLTLVGTASCGMVEHTHSEACRGERLICGYADDDPTHKHVSTCYEYYPACELQEHTHTLACYSDETADVETQLDWQEMAAEYVTGDTRQDLIRIARAQIGYRESTRNYRVDDAGVLHGYTRYGAWYGEPYGDWSAMFASFCLHYAGFSSEETPYNIGASAMKQLWEKQKQFAAKGNHSPTAGDLIFFSDNTVGIVSSVYFDVLKVVQGDMEGAVCEYTVMTYSDTIVGYGLLEPLPSSGSAVLSQFVMSECDCGNEAADAEAHSDVCAYKKQFVTVAEEYTAEQLASVWPQFPADAQSFIRKYLQDNAWKLGSKAEKLDELLTQFETVTADCGGTVISVTGSSLPSGAQLIASLPQTTKEDTFTWINPNIHSLVRYYALYDISIRQGDLEYQPEKGTTVTVTVTFPEEILLDSEYLFVSHIDAETGKIIYTSQLQMQGNSVAFVTDGFSPYLFYTVSKEAEGGETVQGTNWMQLKQSGFFTYWESYQNTEDDAAVGAADDSDGDQTTPPSNSQIDNYGGETVSDDKKVTISKTIWGTLLENVFDITLTVKTQESISEIYEEPDMAVVIVMDISNTMNENFGETTRYEAAMLAAENFLTRFAAQTGKVSKIGYVAFNTSAHKIFDLQTCSSDAQVTALKNTMRQKTGEIINASGYGASHTRFTNIEAGLKMGADMLASAKNEYKYVIFLSDGFPTTYISSGYNGYDPYTSSGTPGKDGVFYDSVVGTHCDYGTSYSDKAAIRARQQAAAMKAGGITIFSIGVDVGGQTIAGYERPPGKTDFSVIDRTSTNYEIGDASSTTAYVNWLRNSIGSGYYYDSTNADGLNAAYGDIFDKILHFKEEASKADWVAQDPLPTIKPEKFEFIGFYDQNGTLIFDDLSGISIEHGENTAVFDDEMAEIMWDLKKSGYTKTEENGVTTYEYKLVYRIRLENEVEGFVENKVYDTNAPTTLTYRVFESVDGETVLSDQRSVNFLIPAVHGYLSEFTFTKLDSFGRPLQGAEFTLTHDTASCGKCRGDGSSHVPLERYTAVSLEDGSVTFTDIPSGHTYVLQETKPPPGFLTNGNTYKVTVAYDVITVSASDKSGAELAWDNTITNIPILYDLPSTGGGGTILFLSLGAVLVTVPLIYILIRRRRRERRNTG